MDDQDREAGRSKWTREYEVLLSTVGSEPLSRLKTHVEYLDEYFLRWLGFCRLETVAPHTLVDNSLFFVVEAASAVTDADVGRLAEPEDAPIVQAWKNYQDSLVTLRKHPQRVKVEAESSYVKFKTFANTFRERYSK
jgi:hypothetical protein